MDSHGAASRLIDEPWYLPLADEVQIFEAAYRARLPVLLKGPTGCGKTRFVEHMAWRLYRQDDSARRSLELPLLTVACHEDLTGLFPEFRGVSADISGCVVFAKSRGVGPAWRVQGLHYPGVSSPGSGGSSYGEKRKETSGIPFHFPGSGLCDHLRIDSPHPPVPGLGRRPGFRPSFCGKRGCERMSSLGGQDNGRSPRAACGGKTQAHRPRSVAQGFLLLSHSGIGNRGPG